MLHTHDSTAHPPISKDWVGFDWVQAQYSKKNVDALKEYRELSKSTGGPTAKYGLRINAELRTAGKMSLAGRALLVSVKTGLHSFEVAEDPSSRISEAVKAAHHFLIDDSNRNEAVHLMVSGYEFQATVTIRVSTAISWQSLKKREQQWVSNERMATLF